MPTSIPRVILIHGFLDSGAIWKPLMACLGSQTEDWLTPDLAGMGSLASDDGPHTLKRYTGDITRLINQAEESVVLVAHSMGTQIAELAAVACPNRVEALALVSPVPLGGVHAPIEVTRPLAATGGDVAAMREGRRGLMAPPVDSKTLDWLTDLGHDVRRSVTEELVKAWNEGVPEGRDPSLFQGPVLVVSGDLDPFVNHDMATAVARRFAHSQQVFVKGAGHWPHAEQPKQLSEPIAEFLAHVMHPTANAKAEAGWTGSFSSQSEKSFGDSLDANVVFEGSIQTRQVVGRRQAQVILGAASRLYEFLEFTHRAKDGDRSFLEWEARIEGGERVSGVTILTSNDQGKIVRVAIHHRPLPAALHFSEAMGKALAGKVEADLFHSSAPAAAN